MLLLQKFINNLLDGEINSPKDVQPYGESLFESLSIDWHSVYDEISGIITFEIPFADIRPFLTPEAQEMIP